ncbi:hypothetical protein PF005_g18849 [Phytophthora fragariae]|uniref:Uncharacterized protein n=1 Tax=Phytophthora fragariae TaxID=53985 RepID=A0A6A4C8B8_9STRA|nr:hypothetical protein PF005_g18849 [Phytophthora fragariae]KAE9284288.1 hypothetical protein PF001_g22459 [Phytophthora fragariae]
MVQRRYLLRQIAPRSVMGKSRSEKVSTSKRERASMRTPALPMAQLLKRSLLSSIALMGVLTSEEHFLTASADGMEMLSSSSNWRRKLVVEASMESCASDAGLSGFESDPTGSTKQQGPARLTFAVRKGFWRKPARASTTRDVVSSHHAKPLRQAFWVPLLDALYVPSRCRLGCQNVLLCVSRTNTR